MTSYDKDRIRDLEKEIEKQKRKTEKWHLLALEVAEELTNVIKLLKGGDANDTGVRLRLAGRRQHIAKGSADTIALPAEPDIIECSGCDGAGHQGYMSYCRTCKGAGNIVVRSDILLCTVCEEDEAVVCLDCAIEGVTKLKSKHVTTTWID